MKSIHKYFFLFHAIVFAALAQTHAQQNDSLIRDNKIEVIKKFKPILSDAIKIPINPNPEKPEFVTPVFKYDLPEKSIDVKPTIYTIKPLSLGTMLLPKLKGNYIKTGFGNYNMPLVEVYLNTVRNKQYQAGLFLKHLSGNGDANYNNFSNNLANAYVKKFFTNGAFGAEAAYFRNVVNLYGSPNDVNTLPNAPKIIYHLFDVKTNYQTYAKDSQVLGYRLDMNYYNFSNSGGFKENDFAIKANIYKPAASIPFELITGLRLNNNMIKDTLSYQRIYFDLNPQIFLNVEQFYLKGGFNSTFSSDTSGGTFHFYPKAEAAYQLIPKKLLMYAGFTGRFDPVTYRSVCTENPFVNNMLLNNTSHKMELYAGFKGELGYQTSFLLSVNSASIENMIFYTQDSASGGQILKYEDSKSQLNTVTLGLQHQWSEKFRIGLLTNIFRYQLHNLSKPFSRPEFETKINSTYNISDKFLLKLDLIYWGERYGRQDALRPDGSVSYIQTKMNPFIDLNMGIDYRYSKNLSAFLNLNNIANNRYQRFYTFQVYGINLMGGFTFTF